MVNPKVCAAVGPFGDDNFYLTIMSIFLPYCNHPDYASNLEFYIHVGFRLLLVCFSWGALRVLFAYNQYRYII